MFGSSSGQTPEKGAKYEKSQLSGLVAQKWFLPVTWSYIYLKNGNGVDQTRTTNLITVPIYLTFKLGGKTQI